MKRNYIHTFVSVDCVVFGFDNENLNILLVKREKEPTTEFKNMKLPGSLIYNDEDVDDAANRVLYELTGIRRMSLRQFRCFASPDRARKVEDQKWLDKEYQPNINRLITVAYLSLCKIDRKLVNISKYKDSVWLPISELPQMPFDHNLIVEESLSEIRKWVESEPVVIFELLPSKFTISQVRKLYEAIYNKKIDVRNFHKKIAAMPYVVALNEKQQNVSHRAARYYKFDKTIYNKR
ncbi:MAG TPA: NUDIX domain-containing protein [Paludibacter sp.]|nr:NUDIX domain-containing protein [Paludibacter sp.]HPM09269.1 NUDIX domain-containing protein [Paludibacter sp.]